MTERGHEVTPFALRYARNEPCADADYFPPPPLDENFVLHGDRPLSPVERARLALKVVRNDDVRRAALRVLREKKIEVVLALQIAHYLYPELILAAHEAGVPVVMRLSDFQMICPAYNCLRDGKPCFLCRTSKMPALVHRCLKNSLAVTAARVAAMTYADLRGASAKVAGFIAPSRFLIEKMKEGGFAAGRLWHLPTPLTLSPDPGPPPDDGPLLFVGGLFPAKGARLAIEAVRGTNHRLVIAGDVDTPDGRELREWASREHIDNIEFAGFVRGEDLSRLYARARAVVVPSLWWENSPHTVLEALAHSRPVVASDHGSLPEQVRDGVTGLLFALGDAGGLLAALQRLDEPGLAERLGRAGREMIAREHDPTLHIQRLERLLEGVLS
ncbi:MAG TPA: glycosyltransferase [bacterium]|nr:glycosyltransferase [bacterium]